MGQKKKKLAKGRLDKFYYLAKEQGYRSRAAFKLIQLNKKYNFLGSAKACLDLCAAPGGWMQVASKYMPVQSLIVGVDLDPIRPIRNCIGLQEDITTQKCRTEIKKALKTWKVDICLHDGAPNMGTSWIQDAYQQAELTLHALKLATEFLTAGGWFVTKVFRGPDYNSLMWVFHQLFKKVDSTKPSASRNVSAEIFVVCQGFLAPKKLDPKLLDPKFVFKEIKEAPKNIDVLSDKKAKRNRSGYEEGVTQLSKIATVKDFVEGNDHLKMLASFNSFEFDVESKMYFDHESTTEEIIQCLRDLKVLGKHDFKTLIKWKKEMLAYKESLEEKKEEQATTTETKEDNTSRLLTKEELDENLDELLKENNSKLEKKKRKEKKKLNEKRSKEQERLRLNMTIPGDNIEQVDDNDLFDLKKGKDDIFEVGASADFDIDELTDSDEENFYDNDEELEMDNEEFMEQQLDEQYSQYLKRIKGKLGDVDVNKVSKDKLSDYSGSGMDELEIEDDEEIDRKLQSDQSSLVFEKKRPSAEKSSSIWFHQRLFNGINQDEDQADDETQEDPDLDRPIKLQKTSQSTKSSTKSTKKEKKEKSSTSSKYQSAPTGKIEDSDKEDNDNHAEAKESFEEVPMEADVEYDSSDSEDEDTKIKTLAMGTMMLRKKVKQDMIDDAFNRYAFNDDALPDWFTHDEDRHNKPQTPLTKEMVAEIKREIREIDSRPIKKIAEAKARKKMRAAKRMEKLKDKANSVVDNEEMSAREKTRAIEKLYANSNKGMAGHKKIVVIGKKFKAGGGGGGKYKVVDKRMKKEVRAQKRAESKKNPSNRRK